MAQFSPRGENEAVMEISSLKVLFYPKIFTNTRVNQEQRRKRWAPKVKEREQRCGEREKPQHQPEIARQDRQRGDASGKLSQEQKA
jgi:hypothetical protein